MSPSVLSSFIKPASHDPKRIEITTHIKQVSPSVLTEEDPDALHPDLTFHKHSEVSGFNTPPTPESVGEDDPVVVVGIGV